MCGHLSLLVLLWGSEKMFPHFWSSYSHVCFYVTNTLQASCWMNALRYSRWHRVLISQFFAKCLSFSLSQLLVMTEAKVPQWVTRFCPFCLNKMEALIVFFVGNQVYLTMVFPLPAGTQKWLSYSADYLLCSHSVGHARLQPQEFLRFERVTSNL